MVADAQPAEEVAPPASLIDGAIADAYGVRVAGIALSIPAALAALLITRRLRRLGAAEPATAQG